MMFNKSFLVSALIICFIWPMKITALDFYVSPSGNDKNPGAKNKPFASLEVARDAVRQKRGDHPLNEAVNIWLAGGVYHRDKPFMLEEKDGGTEAFPVAYRACPDQTVRIIGGLELTLDDFTLVTDPTILNRLDPAARGNVLQLDLQALGILPFDPLPDDFTGNAQSPELFFDHRPMTVARWPDDGWAVVDTIVDPGKPRDQSPPDGQPATFTYKEDRPRRWTRAGDLWLHGYWQYDWTDSSRKVLRLDTDNRSITIVPENHWGLGGGNSTPRRFYAFNLLEELTQPGEWVLDRQSMKVYFWPPTTQPHVAINLSLLKEPLVKVQKAVHLTFDGITFELTRSDGITVSDSSHITIRQCTLRNIGGTAIEMAGGEKNLVADCRLYHCGTGAVSLKGGDRITLTPAGHQAVNNHIYNYSRLKRTYSAAVRLEGVGQIAAHNLIHDAPHLAILYLGNDHLMEYNEIHHVDLETSDAGVIYTGRDWTFRGNVVRYNFLHHNGVKFAPPVKDPDGIVEGFVEADEIGVFGVYLDDYHSSTAINGNVIHGSRFGVLIGGGRDNVVTNNIMIECDHAVALCARGIAWPEKIFEGLELYRRLNEVPYQTPPWSTHYPKLAVILDYAPRVPIGNIVRDNVFYDCGESIHRIGRWMDDFSRIGGYYETQDDPGFIDTENNNFQLRDDSVIYQKLPNFEKIPFEQIGLQ